MRILEILEMSQAEYDQVFYDFLLQWCESVTYTEAQLQNVISNQPIIRWYKIEHQKRENQFLAIAKRYQESNTVSRKDLLKKYCECIYTLMSISPKPLVEATRPKEIIKPFDSHGLGKLLTFNIN